MDDSQLCIADEQAAFEFLARAVPIIAAAGIQPATLDLLDSMNKHANAYGLGERPGMAALAAEWAGPYATEAADGEGPTTVRALVIAALGADAEGNYDFGFRTYASNETEHWSLEGTPLDGVPVFGLYVIREGEATYCCSMTPSSWAINLENVFCYGPQDDLPKVNQYGQTAIEAYMDNENPSHEGLEDTYFGYFGDRDGLDKREAAAGDVSRRVAFDMSALRVDVSKLDDFAASPADPRETDASHDFATLQAAFQKAAADDAWEEAREYFQGNPIYPRVIQEA